MKSEAASNVVNNICTILGGALLLYPLIEEATKTLAPELEKITSGEYAKEIPLLTDGKKGESEQQQKGQDENKPAGEPDEITELRRKLAEYEEKEKADTHKAG